MRNDADSYRRFLDGDDDGLVEIIDRYHHGLSLFINTFTNDICDAEEIMQETFVKLAVKKPKFRQKSGFKTWLFAIARNCALDYLKKKSKQTAFPIDECFQLSDETDIEKLYLLEEQKIALHQAMKKLNPTYYQVLYLMYFEDFDTESIALVMHKSTRQIGDLLYRAKQSLKSELERTGFRYEEY